MNKRKYGLFEQQNEKWIRIFPTLSFPLKSAQRLFQDALLAPVFFGIDGVHVKGVRELRPVKE